MGLTDHDNTELTQFLGELAFIMIDIGKLPPGQATAGQTSDLRLRIAGVGRKGSYLAAKQGTSVSYKKVVSGGEAQQAGLLSIIGAVENFDFNNSEFYKKLSEWLGDFGTIQVKMLENKNVTNEFNMQEVESNANALENIQYQQINPLIFGWWGNNYSSGNQDICNAGQEINSLWFPPGHWDK
jgi:hypothetical protein